MARSTLQEPDFLADPFPQVEAYLNGAVGPAEATPRPADPATEHLGRAAVDLDQVEVPEAFMRGRTGRHIAIQYLDLLAATALRDVDGETVTPRRLREEWNDLDKPATRTAAPGPTAPPARAEPAGRGPRPRPHHGAGVHRRPLFPSLHRHRSSKSAS
jgi:hypothetical protein